MESNQKKVLITGVAGFIGFHLASKLLNLNYLVHGLDNLNDYYDVNLKLERLSFLKKNQNFIFHKIDLTERETLFKICELEKFDLIINLAAQAGVRYSIKNPFSYIDSNIVGFINILEAAREYKPEKLIYASSSSVYGLNKKVPFSVGDTVDEPISLYAATKRSNELMAYTYSHLYQIQTIGLRFFTVYGPFGRPDMAYFSFAEKILKGESIDVFNFGELYRDFTYINDIIQGILLLIQNPVNIKKKNLNLIYNIGNNKPVKLLYFIELLEKYIGKEAKKNFLPMQPGDVNTTYADIEALKNDTGFEPSTNIEIGLQSFVEWFLKWKTEKKY